MQTLAWLSAKSTAADHDIWRRVEQALQHLRRLYARGVRGGGGERRGVAATLRDENNATASTAWRMRGVAPLSSGDNNGGWRQRRALTIKLSVSLTTCGNRQATPIGTWLTPVWRHRCAGTMLAALCVITLPPPCTLAACGDIRSIENVKIEERKWRRKWRRCALAVAPRVRSALSS